MSWFSVIFSFVIKVRKLRQGISVDNERVTEFKWSNTGIGFDPCLCQNSCVLMD